MRAPLSWIKDFVEIPSSLTVEEISKGLVRVGFEVEDVIFQGSDIKGPLSFAEVLSIEEITEFKKPIRYVGIDCGEKQTRYVICGATNFKVGDIVLAALPGAEGEFRIVPKHAVALAHVSHLREAVIQGVASKENPTGVNGIKVNDEFGSHGRLRGVGKGVLG